MLKKFLSLLFITVFLVSCGQKANPVLDEDFKRGFNGILWGENRQAAANWIQAQKGIPARIIQREDTEVLKAAKKFRKDYLKTLRVKTITNIDDAFVVLYSYLGLRYLLSFDEKNHFCAVTFGPPTPAPPLAPDPSVKATEEKFLTKIVDPLIEKYGKPRKISKKKDNVTRKYWIWEGKKINYVVEFIFVEKTDKHPTFWQHSESVLLRSPKFYTADVS